MALPCMAWRGVPLARLTDAKLMEAYRNALKIEHGSLAGSWLARRSNGFFDAVLWECDRRMAAIVGGPNQFVRIVH